jgi:hypothetical protein
MWVGRTNVRGKPKSISGARRDGLGETNLACNDEERSAVNLPLARSPVVFRVHPPIIHCLPVSPVRHISPYLQAYGSSRIGTFCTLCSAALFRYTHDLMLSYRSSTHILRSGVGIGLCGVSVLSHSLSAQRSNLYLLYDYGQRNSLSGGR